MNVGCREVTLSCSRWLHREREGWMLWGRSLQSRRSTKCSSHSCSCQGWTICKVTGFVEAVTQQRVPPCQLLHTHVASNSCWWVACFGHPKLAPGPYPAFPCFRWWGICKPVSPCIQSWKFVHSQGLGLHRRMKDGVGISWSKAFQVLKEVWEEGGEVENLI